MCFSATASFTSATILVGVGIAALIKNKNKKAILLCTIPLLFGIQQAIEGLNWITPSSSITHQIATYGFLFFAFLLWPTYEPLAVMLLEKNKTRKKIMSFLIVLGFLVSLSLLITLLITNVSSSIANHCIQYSIDGPSIFNVNYGPYLLTAAIGYFIATCITPLISSDKKIFFFGATLTSSLIISLYFYFQNFTSVWCFFGAILSIIIYIYAKNPTQKISK